MTCPAKTSWSSVKRFAAHVDASTPPQRDRAVDALRALAIAGVIGGHWLVTALVSGSAGGTPALGYASPLASMPALAPVSWIFQTLAVFFLVGGYSAARGYRGDYFGCASGWAALRVLSASSSPSGAPVTAALWIAGVPLGIIHTLLTLVVDPLWFLGVYAVLTALTPAAMCIASRFGPRAALLPAGVVAAVDLARFALHGPGWLGRVNLPAGWFVPYLFGVAWALGKLHGRRGPALMLAGGAAATAALIILAGYPASMVGVNGARISNLNPPTLAAVTFGIAQCGLALLARDRLARWMRRPLAWAAVATANLSAMTLFLWHQTAFIAVTSAGLLAGLCRAADRSHRSRLDRRAAGLAAGVRRGARRALAGVPPHRAPRPPHPQDPPAPADPPTASASVHSGAALTGLRG